MKKIKTIIWFTPVVTAVGLYLWIYTAVSAETLAAPTATRVGWEDSVQISSVTTEAQSPVIATAPNGNVMVAYHRAKDDSPLAFDIHYEQSTNQGDSWSGDTIHQDPIPTTNASQVAIDYDANSVAHAVWLADTDTIAYADQTMWLGNTVDILYTGETVLTPEIVASSPDTLDVIWSAFSGVRFNIYHLRSESGGSTWPGTPTVVNDSFTIPLLSTPALAVNGGKVYAVWEDNPNFPSDQGVIYYAESNGTTWGGVPIPISTPAHDAHEASILIKSDRVVVAYTHWTDQGSRQWLYQATCLLADDCTQTAKWLVSEDPISGAAVGVNAQSPWNIFSDLIEYGDSNCSYAHFHGTSDIYVQESELIWSTNSCNDWTVNDDRQPLTVPQVQTIFPSLAKDSTYLYLVYQQNTVGNDTYQIYFQRGEEISVPRNNLTITYEGGGEGAIDLRPHNTPAGKGCTDSCVQAFDVMSVAPDDTTPTTTDVFMYPTAAAGSAFMGFTGDAGCAEWAVSMGTDMSCTAHFSLAVYLPVILK